MAASTSVQPHGEAVDVWWYPGAAAHRPKESKDLLHCPPEMCVAFGFPDLRPRVTCGQLTPKPCGEE